MIVLHKPFTLFKPVVLIGAFLCLIYSQTLSSSWHMDDYDNITQNPKIHMEVLSWASIKASLYATPSFENTLYRPVSNLSFALNWFFGGNNVIGYHLVNITIHILASLVLYLTVIQLLQTPNAGKWDPESLYFIALLSAVLWAIHPIQIQAVTYIVQRMTSLAALFYIMGIFFFLKARMAQDLSRQIVFVGICVFSFLLGLGSKNNAILLPVSLLLIEFIFFQDLSQKSVKKKAVIIIVSVTMLIAVAGVLIFFEKGLSQILDPYKVKPFTMGQRLLTQPSVLLFYLSQIFYPTANRFSISHDVTYATDLFQPWYTIFSITILFLLIGISLWRIKKNPIFSFAVLFYFGNQIIESSFIALEMVFEHRNYLPSLFLFLPVSIGIQKMMNRYKTNKKSMYYLMVGFVCALMIGIGFSTYIRNYDWRSTYSLWQDAAEKSPGSARPLHNLAWGYYEPSGQFEKAIGLYQVALTLRDDQAYYKVGLYNNIAGIYCYKLKYYDKAIDNARKAIDIKPDYLPAQLTLSDSLAMLGQYEEALAGLNHVLESNPSNSFNPDVHFLKASIHMKTKEFDQAFTHFRQCIHLAPDNWIYLRDIGVCLTIMGYHDRGYWFINLARRLNPGNNAILLALADNRLKKGSVEEASVHIAHLIQTLGLEEIEKILKGISDNLTGCYFNIPGLSQLIASRFQELSDSYKKDLQALP